MQDLRVRGCMLYGPLDGVGIFVCHTSIPQPADPRTDPKPLEKTFPIPRFSLDILFRMAYIISMVREGPEPGGWKKRKLR